MLTSACIPRDPDLKAIGYGKQFILNYNSAVLLENGSRLIFTDLLGESRCPDGALCAWEGEAIILVTLESPDTTRFQSEMTLRGYATQASTTGHDTLSVGSLSVILLQLDPYPQIDHTEPKQHYKAVFLVEETSPLSLRYGLD